MGSRVGLFAVPAALTSANSGRTLKRIDRHHGGTMDPDLNALAQRRFSVRLHGATIHTLHCDSARPGALFGEDIVDQLTSEGMLGQVLWSTSCTPADVSAGAFPRLRDAGLFLARLDLAGVAGNPGRLTELGSAVQILRRLGILVEYDLDLFGGSPRFAAIRDNLRMLRVIVGDGNTPAVFRYAPADGNCSPWLDTFRNRLADAVAPWLEEGGLAGQLAEAWAEMLIAERLLLGLYGVAAHRIALQRLTLRCNMALLSLVAGSAADFEASGETALLDQKLIAPQCARLFEMMSALRNGFQSAPAPALSSDTPNIGSATVISTPISFNHQPSATGKGPFVRTV